MITKTNLENYIYIKKCINDTEKKIKYYESRPPCMEYAIVKGSSKSFPFSEKNFHVSGFNGPSADKWNKKINELHSVLLIQKQKLEELKIGIELFIQDIPILSTRLIFSYIYIDGMDQEDVARKLSLTQSAVSKRITRYLDETSA